MCRVSTAPTATAGRSGLNWKKFSLSTRSVSQYPRAAREPPTPRRAVRVPVRDAAPCLAASLASLARQTEPGYELIAVDDGSRDESGEILEAASRRDPRIVVRHTSARALPAPLNLALSLARAPWIARHDADDVSHRERFARQLAWLDAHPRVGVLAARGRLV